MKTDDIFYQIFQNSPELAFELMGQTAPCDYEFRAQEVKAFGFRTDGLMFPCSNDPTHPLLLLEAQMQPDADLYYRILNELTTYLRQYKPPNSWQVVVLYPRRSVERAIPQMERIFAFCNLHRVYLNELVAGRSLEQDILRLIVSPRREAESAARELWQRAREELSEPQARAKFVEFLVELVVRIFPHLSREEVREMLNLVPVSETRFYREVKQEGREEGREEGRAQEARSLVVRLLSKRFGDIPPEARTQIEKLALEQAEALAETLLDFNAIADLLAWLQQNP